MEEECHAMHTDIIIPIQVGDDMVKHLESYAEKGDDFNAKHMMINYTLDSIATCGFGVEINSFANPNGEFKEKV